MTIRTFFGRWLVEQNLLPLGLALQGVTHGAFDASVTSLQRKLSAFVVIECRWRPLLDHVAIRASGNPGLCGKLRAVRVAMARFAILRRSFELNFIGTLNYLMAVTARDRAMSPEQGEFCFRMVEAADVDPRTRRVTGLAAQNGAVGSTHRHAVLEFSLVGIAVACGAGSILEMKWQDLVRSPGEPGFVTIRACHGRVGPGRGKTRVLMFRDREG